MDTSKEKIAQFVHKTGSDANTAKDLLQEAKWNVENAVKTYRFLKVSALPPAGPQKNVENQGSTALEKRLKRGLSKSCENAHIVSKAREIVLNDLVEDGDGEHLQHLLETSEYSFILPNIRHYQEDYKAFLHKDLIETSTLVSLEQAGRLNWWAEYGVSQRLLPLATTGDGNCLLHAASLGMWGFHDRLLTLRTALHTTIKNSTGGSPLWRRWRWQQTQSNRQSDLILTEDQWKEEWNYLLQQSSTKPRLLPGTTHSCCDSAATKGLMERTVERDQTDDAEVSYMSLEEFHVFVLANVLRRPIIVVADTILKDQDGEALAPIPFGGLYLPLECSPSECHRSPLLLTYDAAHFSALLTMDLDESEQLNQLPAAIPLVHPDFELLPIHFLVDPGPGFVWNKDEHDAYKCKNLEMSKDQKLSVIKRYLEVATLPITKHRCQNNGEDDVDGSSRPRSNSFSGSIKTRSNSDTPEINGFASQDATSLREKSNTLDGKTNSLKDYTKDKEKTGSRNKLDKKMMQNVAKSFGSLGRSVSKKFKKMGVIGKNTAKDEVDYGGSVTQSTKVVNHAELSHSSNTVLCVKLLVRRLEYQDKMVENYLLEAYKRFVVDRDIKKRQDEEMKRKAEIKRLSGMAANGVAGHEAPLSEPEVVEMECINKQCQGKGVAETCYLCPECFSKQKEEETSSRQQSPAIVDDNDCNLLSLTSPNQSRSLGTLSTAGLTDDGNTNNSGIKTTTLPPIQRQDKVDGFLGHTRNKSDGISRQNTLIDVGKSKFYTYYDEEQSLVLTKKNTDLSSSNINKSTNTNHPSLINNMSSSSTTSSVSNSSELNNLKLIKRDNKGRNGAAVELCNSSFYDESLSNPNQQQEYQNQQQNVNVRLSNPNLRGGPGFVNNLHNEWQENGSYSKQDKYIKAVPLAKEYTNQNAVTVQQQMNISPTRRKAFKISSDYEKQWSDVLEDVDRNMGLNATGGMKNNIDDRNISSAAKQDNKGKNNLQHPCKVEGCKYYGTIATDFYCSSCFKQKQKTIAYKIHSLGKP